MNNFVIGSLALAAALVGGPRPAAAYGDKEHPLVYNNDPAKDGDPRGQSSKYTPKDVLKPSFVFKDNAIVYLAASQSRDTFGDGLKCLVNTSGTRGAGGCATAEAYQVLDKGGGKFQLQVRGTTTCLAVATTPDIVSAKTGKDTSITRDVWKLEARTCSEAATATLEHVGRAGAPDGGAYDRYIVKLSKPGQADYAVFFGGSPRAKAGVWELPEATPKTPLASLDLQVVKLTELDPKAVHAGVSVLSCRGACGPRAVAVRKPSHTLSSITSYLALAPAVTVKELANGKKPNIVFFFIDTLRADAVNDVLMPNLTSTFGGLSFKYSVSGASATQQSTYALLNMRPGFEREWVIRNRDQDPVGEVFGNGGLATAILKRLGYKVVLFSRPDWFDTFIFTPGKNFGSPDYTTRYSVELPLAAPFDFTGAAAKRAEDLEGLTGTDAPATVQPATKISGAELGRLTYSDHDLQTIRELKAYLTGNRKALEAGGHVLFVYLSSVHTAQIPLGGADLRGQLVPAPDRPYKDLATTKTVDLGGKAPRELYDELLASPTTDRELLASSYYNHASFADMLFGDAMSAYAGAVKQGDHYLVVMGDHGESLWENGHSLHGHRPAHKSIEAPVLIGKVASGKLEPIAPWHADQTVAQVDIFPALFRSLAGKDALAAWGLAPYLYTADWRDGCHLSSEANLSRDPRRFAIFDSKTGAKTLFVAPPTGALDSGTFYATQLTDYWDNPLPEDRSFDLSARCFELLVHKGYQLVGER